MVAIDPLLPFNLIRWMSAVLPQTSRPMTTSAQSFTP